ncbi:hypothetical protein BD309DRAFT_956812, partial [Dichomitus squalens]
MDTQLDSPVHEKKCKGCKDLPAARHTDVRTRAYHATSPGRPRNVPTFMLRRIYAVNIPVSTGAVFTGKGHLPVEPMRRVQQGRWESG